MSSRDPLPDAAVEIGAAAVQCRHCHRPLTRHHGIGGVQWRDDSPHSPAVCFKARSLTHDPEPILCWFCSHIHTETLICRAVAIDGEPCVCRYEPIQPTARAAAMTTIPLPWTSPPLSANDRGHTRYRSTNVATALDDARWAVRAARPRKMVGANVTLHFRVKDRRRRDADNLAPTLKVVQDALVLEGVLPDDSWVHIPRATCEIHPPNGEPAAMWVELTDPDVGLEVAG